MQVGKIQTVTVVVKKYNFPRIRNLPNKVICEDETGKLDCIFFNSYEGYIRKILPINAKVTISGKIGYYNKKYQITNPTHLSEDPNSVKKIDKSYSLTEGLNNKLYNIFQRRPVHICMFQIEFKFLKINYIFSRQKNILRVYYI